MIERWWKIAWRTALAFTFFLLLFGTPFFYILFASEPLNPLASLASLKFDHFGWRVAAAAGFVALLALIGSLIASRDTRNPWADFAEIMRRIGTGDFRVRINTIGKLEPREWKEVREALNAMAADLEQAEEQRSNLIADVSHELRTPLTVLEGNLRAALDHVYTLDDAEIANLYGQTRHLIRLVNDLHELALADARRLPLAMQPTDLNALLDETLQIFTPLAEEREVALCSEIAPLPCVTVDEARIRQVLHNVLTNALRHTPPGGTITVAGKADEREVTMTIADTGDGMSEEQLNAVFNRFYRADKSRSRDTGGTGLGLAIVSAIVATHGGAVEAASDGMGHGSTFTIRLPIMSSEL